MKQSGREKSNSRQKKIWIDLDNSPHVPFFNPIIKELEKKDWEVVVSVRDCFQTCGLADLVGLKYSRIGRHYGKNKAMKVAGTVFRAMQLLPMALKEKPALSVSHGSRSQLMASVLLGIPDITLFDYEFTRGLGPIAPNWVMAPEVIAAKSNSGAKNKLLQYPGIKEDVYVPGFNPDQHVLDPLNLTKEDFVVTIRPPATEAHYHNPESEKLFEGVVERLSKSPEVRMVILPRNEIKQTAWIRERWPDLMSSRRIIIPDHVVNGLDLMWFSDFVVSGGGTMNREAAALGVPVYSIFRGKIGAVDRYLEQEGRLTLLTSVEDVQSKVILEKRDKEGRPGGDEKKALSVIVETIIKCAQGT